MSKTEIMPTITFISPNEQKTIVKTEAGKNLMEAAVENDVPGIDADCQGGCACATCHIIIPDDFKDLIPAMDEDEQYLLDFLDNQQKNSRLSCQIEITGQLDGMIVTVPEES